MVCERERARGYVPPLARSWSDGWSVRSEALSSLISTVSVQRGALRRAEVTEAALVGRLRVAVARPGVGRRAQAQIMEAGQGVAQGALR